MPFEKVETSVDFPALERAVLKFWNENGIFEKRKALNAGKPKWSFLDGPITANNPMGAHHAWGRTYKDVFQRYWAMHGFDQRWQNGFDCQGLWVEVEVEKEQGFKTKRDIEAFGLAAFVNLCKQRVLEYAAVQTQQSIRLGYWMDWNDPAVLRELKARMAEDPTQVITVQGPHGPVTDRVELIVGRLGLPEMGGSYFTFSNENNYSIWVALKKCHDHGWIYKGRDVMPWCGRCGTGISQHEIVTEGYQEIVDPGLTVKFPLKDRPGESLLVWTTTPWTLTSNVAAAVGPELTYLKVRQGNDVYFVGKGAAKQTLRGDYEVLDELKGDAMVGWKYHGPFDELPAEQASGAIEAHQVIPWTEVGEEEGTGIVHIAPGCGAEDFALSKAYNLPAPAPLDEDGYFITGYDWLTGRAVADSADLIADNLRQKGVFYRLEPYSHRYPVCWRCNTKLVFRLVDEWFISMDKLRHAMIEVTQQIRWIPEFGLERELDWLRNMHDWMISKKRYWGLALPIWTCDECGWFDVIGGETELKSRAAEGWERFEGHTPHRPHIDAVKIRCAQCGGVARRIPDVGNPWLDAGIVSMSTLNYRHDRAYWEKWFPADFITESFPGQFRNWFYSLLAMSTAIENRPPFLNVLGFATLLAEDGRAMHKSWGNAIEFNEAADSMGADVMRWMYASQRPEKDLLFGYHGADEVRRRFLLPLWNVYAFFVQYANASEWRLEIGDSGSRTSQISNPQSLLDRWITARLQVLIHDMTARLEDFDAAGATQAAEAFVDDLSNWYVRRSRRRFWEGQSDALDTLYNVLTTLVKLFAPVIPFVTETMYQNLVRAVTPAAPESVHHQDWPLADETQIDQELLDDMALAMRLVALGRAARGSANVKLRQPLATATLALRDPAEQPRVERLADVIRDELNVKALEFVTDEGELVEYRVRPVLPVLGPKYGKLVPRIRATLATLSAAEVAHKVRAGEPVELDLGLDQPEDPKSKIQNLKSTVRLEPGEVEVMASAKPGFAVAEEAGYVVAVTTALTPELEQEGLAREVVRKLQTMRKDAGFDISDRIVTYYQAEGRLLQAIQAFAGYIKDETLTVNLREAAPPGSAFTESVEVDGNRGTFGVELLIWHFSEDLK